MATDPIIRTTFEPGSNIIRARLLATGPEARTKAEAASKIRAIASQHDAMIERIRSHGVERIEGAFEFADGLSMMAPALVGAGEPFVEAISNEVEKIKSDSDAYRRRLLRHVGEAAEAQNTPAKTAIQEYKRAEEVFNRGQIQENAALDAGVHLVREVHGQSPRLSSAPNDGGLWPAFEDWKRIKSPVGDTISEAEASVRRFIELIGDKRLSEIDKSDVRAYRSALIKFPRHLPKDIVRLTLPEILQTTEGNSPLTKSELGSVGSGRWFTGLIHCRRGLWEIGDGDGAAG